MIYDFKHYFLGARAGNGNRNGRVGEAANGNGRVGQVVLEIEADYLPVTLHHTNKWLAPMNSQVMLKARPGKNVLTLLRTLTGDPEARFRSSEQDDAAQYIVNTQTNLLVILPTGTGKSLLMFLASLADPTSTSLVVVPTVALRQDLVSRAVRHGISVATSLADFGTQSLLLLTPEAIAMQGAFAKLDAACHSQRIQRVFIDEIHMVCTDSSWRPTFLGLHVLGLLRIPMILLSGTCPPHVAAEIEDLFFRPANIPLTIRQLTNRHNIAYAVKTGMPITAALPVMARGIAALIPGEKAIVYVTRVQDAGAISMGLVRTNIPALPYHAELPDDLRAVYFSRWKDGRAKVLVATSAFGVGVDDPNVKLVYMCGLPYSFLDYLQQSGRAGRGGASATTILFLDEFAERDRVEKAKTAGDREKLLQLLTYALAVDVCRRRVISRYVDHKETACAHIPDCSLCDVCYRIAHPEVGDQTHIGVEDQAQPAPLNAALLQPAVHPQPPPLNVVLPQAANLPPRAYLATVEVFHPFVPQTPPVNAVRPLGPSPPPAPAAALPPRQGNAIPHFGPPAPPLPLAAHPRNAARPSVSPVVFVSPQNPPVQCSFGSEVVALNAMLARSTLLTDLQTSIELVGGTCGACLVTERRLTRHANSSCPLSRSRCKSCYKTDHQMMNCPVKNVAISGGSFCFKCLLPSGNPYHEQDFSGCKFSLALKDWYRYASSHSGIVPGVDHTNIDISALWRLFADFCKPFRG